MYPNWQKLWNVPLEKNKKAGAQLIDRIVQLVNDADLVEGDRLPPLYLMASKLKTTSGTIQSVYTKLKEKHIIEIKPGIGSFIANYIPLKKPGKTIMPYCDHVWLFKAPQPLTSNGLIPFLKLGSGIPDCGRLSFNEYASFLLKTVYEIEKRKENFSVFQSEVHDTMHRVLEKRGIIIHKDQFKMIPNGAALRCVVKTIINPGDIVIMDSPNDIIPLECFKEKQANILFCGTDQESLNLNKLEKLCKVNTLKAVFVRPSASYPELKFLTEQGRERLIALSVKYKFIVISMDDNFGWWHKQPIAPLILRAHEGRVIYIGPVSKVLKITNDMGLIVAPPPVIKAIETEAYKCGVTHDLAIELTIARLLQREWITSDSGRLLKFYRNQQKKLGELFTAHLSDDAILTAPRSGLHLYISFNQPLNVSPILEKLSLLGLYDPCKNLHTDLSKPVKGIHLGYATAILSTWEKAFILLAKHIQTNTIHIQTGTAQVQKDTAHIQKNIVQLKGANSQKS